MSAAAAWPLSTRWASCASASYGATTKGTPRARISAIVAWTIADDTDTRGFCSCAHASRSRPCARSCAAASRCSPRRLAAPAVLPRLHRQLAAVEDEERPHAVLGEEAEHPQREREVRRRRLAAHQLARARARSRRGGATTTRRPRRCGRGSRRVGVGGDRLDEFEESLDAHGRFCEAATEAAQRAPAVWRARSALDRRPRRESGAGNQRPSAWPVRLRNRRSHRRNR